ncbi:MAG: hypothetical protein HS129_06995 [Leptospiraceae bacterium]|nr:hypothetical protein [Leptospiraceae bacterium]
MTVKSWIHDQTDLNIAQFDTAMEIYYPESKSYVRDPGEHIKRICEECNYLEAVKLIEWNKYLSPGSSVMDMGCGGGWLTAYLSKFEFVKTIYALDSSKQYLSGMMPQVVKLMEGKIKKVLGLVRIVLYFQV